jgi:bifunctional non-homologous end joining protein LigD
MSVDRKKTARVKRKPADTAPRKSATRKTSSAVEHDGPSSAARELPVKISNPDKPYWPDDGFTKLDLIHFYDDVFPWLQPFVKDRMLSLERCPDGMRGGCFYQKEKPNGLPPDTPTKRIQHHAGVTNYVVGGKRETQLALANLGCIPVHVWGSRQDTPRQPDWVCFDLDPTSGEFADAARAALRVKEALDALQLTSFVKTSGSRGVHVLVPIKVGPDADDVKEFALALGAQLARAYPDELTDEGRIANRGGRTYLDAFRNGFAQTVVTPYSVRRRPRAPVSMPIDWSELDPAMDPAAFNITNAVARLEKSDPWRDFFRSRQSLASAMRAVRSL